jgi:hypothetical protein
MRRLRERKKAAGLKPVVTWVVAGPKAPTTWSSHRLLEARSLAMHALIARKIERDPTLLQIARDNIDRWDARRGGECPAWLDEWREWLNKPWQSIAMLITDPGENAARLRQSSPFAGILAPQERQAIHEAFRA